MDDVDEFTYPPRVQAALDFVERETRERREEARWERQLTARWREEARERDAVRQREADSDAKFWETRRAQQAAQQAKRRFRPAQPDGWVKP